MKEINLEPDWRVMGRYMATVLKADCFESEKAKEEFRASYEEVMAYLKFIDPEGYLQVMEYNQFLIDLGEVPHVETARG